jgi:insertion element IS1 protein InsB
VGCLINRLSTQFGHTLKRPVRKTICFSKSIEMHDIIIGLFVNRYEFGLSV